MKYTILTMLCLSAVSQATTIVPSWRGATNSEYAQWDVFTEAFAPVPSVAALNTPDNGSSAGNDALVIQTVGGGFLTSGGNIYNAGSANNFQLTDSASYDVDSVVLQVVSLGSEFDYTTFSLNGNAPTYTRELARIPLGGFGGEQVEYLVEWDLSGAPISASTSYTIAFNGAAAHNSLDQVILDTQGLAPLASFESIATQIPEPSSAGLLSLALLGVAFKRKR